MVYPEQYPQCTDRHFHNTPAQYVAQDWYQ
jgi:hypothetical protein